MPERGAATVPDCTVVRPEPMRGIPTECCFAPILGNLGIQGKVGPEVAPIGRKLDPAAEQRIALAEVSGLSKSIRRKSHQIYDIWKARQDLAPTPNSFRPVLPLGRDQCIVGGNFRIFGKNPKGLRQDGIRLVEVPAFPKGPTEAEK